MDLLSLLKKVTNRLKKAEISYMVSGGVAVSYWGFPRTTHDIDIVIEAKKEDKEKIVALFEKDFYFKNIYSYLSESRFSSEARGSYISPEAAEDAIETRFTFNIIHHQSGLKVDFWLVKKEPFGILEFKRRLRKKIFDKEIFIISPEDLVLTKLLAYKETRSHRRLEDAESILKSSKVDLKYIKNWAEKQSTIKILEEIL